MLKRSGLTLYAKATSKGKELLTVRTHSLRVFINRTRTINWQELKIKVYLKVGYGRKKDNFGKLTEFYNDGVYSNMEDFTLAANAFINANTPAGTPEKIYKF